MVKNDRQKRLVLLSKEHFSFKNIFSAVFGRPINAGTSGSVLLIGHYFPGTLTFSLTEVGPGNSPGTQRLYLIYT